MTHNRSLRPDARLVQLHAERGEPAQRLSSALADLEEADWGLLFAGEAALARQLAALLGPGTLRVDGRLNINRAAFAEAGLAVADLYGDLGSARAAWLLEPDDRVLERVRRAGVQVIVDGTLAPGGGWPTRGADYVVYTDAATLTGHADAPLSALFGLGEAPQPTAPAPSDLSVALALRDVATLPLRLARAARTVSNLQSHLGATARPAAPTALLLAPDAAADTLSPLGGVLAAVRHVPEGVLLTPGLEDTDNVLALLRGEPAQQRGTQVAAHTGLPTERQENSDVRQSRHPEARSENGRSENGRSENGRSEDARNAEVRSEGPGRQQAAERERTPERHSERTDRRPDRRQERDRGRRFEQVRFGQPQQNRPQQSQQGQQGGQSGQFRPAPDRPNTDNAAPEVPERFVFEAPSAAQQPAKVPEVHPPFPVPDFPVPEVAEEVWESEIVFSDLEHTPPPLTHTVSSGPDAPEELLVPDVLHQPEELAQAAQPNDLSFTLVSAQEGSGQEHGAEVTASLLSPDLPPSPDLPTGKEDPAAGLTDEQAIIYTRLRDWRNAEAKRQEVSKFIVASNATLAEIARRIPYTAADLKAVKGMGTERMKKYGEQILELVRG